MTTSVLICIANGSEEIETVTTADLLVRAGIQVTLASVTEDGALEITASRGIKLVADLPIIRVADEPFDAIVLPGGLAGAEAFRDSPLVVEKVRRMHLDGKIVAAICAAPALVLEYHQLFPLGNMTGFPSMRDKIPAHKWVDKRVYFDERVNLLTSQGPATAFDFALKLIELLQGRETAANVASQLVLPPGINDYLED
ncbi:MULTISPECIES: protein deglycase YajL [Providencia]|jgi:4-methyl-5(b-hydroxyethyl)-thiazole monophosphate biosynthesis|uniref:4-methyl-5(B-hydroxyethyl)-thiazole monophosphate biosynthesis n=1 Tax=Providencia alcalifaciens TaxID=126385 RepID=A0A4R3NIY1_9GAMM|nr:MULTISPECIES: protein deglycase YajL [Providencia]MBC5789408.1 protein deglycase YajL [Providencia sp. JUb39]MDR2243040.1 protein deglycase YajL [Providencia alcalifaciens]MTB45365.1 protein deglycase YajL [Providencia sp. wls1950]MTC24234.1 protein deglycase YajL [Providencia sp. wls1938]MTC44677.1 protein deglycase YajL [Providencia sp. wls1922]